MTREDEPDVARRRFFRDAVSGLIGPLADYLEGQTDRWGREMPEVPWLRPPGAIAERDFLDTCYRCGACVDACPASAITPLRSPDDELSETPAIRPAAAACVVCEGLQCTHACPSGALLPLDDPHLIRMGIAEVNASACVRSRDESCTECVDKCPLGPAAIRFNDEGPPEVLPPLVGGEGGCIGCGVCEFYCPTTPKAIVVKPS